MDERQGMGYTGEGEKQGMGYTGKGEKQGMGYTGEGEEEEEGGVSPASFSLRSTSSYTSMASSSNNRLFSCHTQEMYGTQTVYTRPRQK